MGTDNYIKGVCFEFTNKDDILNEEELNFLKEECILKSDMTEYNKALEEVDYYKLHGIFLDNFLKRDDIFSRWRDCGVNHLLLHVKIEENKRIPGSITSQKFTSLECDNTEEYYLTALFKKCHDYNITPAIKLMIDGRLNIDFVNKNKELFFSQYKNIIKYLFICDIDKYIDLITIGNETHLIRKYANLKSYWKDVIDMIHESFPKVKVSASQFCVDMSTGEYDIADILDIVGINRYPKNTNWPDTPTYEEMLPEMYNDADIYNTQEFCKNNNTTFMITECGVSHWSGQCREPEMGNSMINFYNKGYDYIMQAAYIKSSLIASENMDYCVGHCILCGVDYDPIFKYDFNYPLKGAITDNFYGFEAIKSVWRG